MPIRNTFSLIMQKNAHKKLRTEKKHVTRDLYNICKYSLSSQLIFFLVTYEQIYIYVKNENA